MSDLFLIAHIAGRSVAVDSAQVESVVDIGEITPIPRAPRLIRGLAALRSRVVTVVDTRIALGLPSERSISRAIILLVEGHHYALLVDALEDVAPFALQPLANGMALEPAWRAIARGIVERDGEPVLAVSLLDLVPGLAPALAA